MAAFSGSPPAVLSGLLLSSTGDRFVVDRLPPPLLLDVTDAAVLVSDAGSQRATNGRNVGRQRQTVPEQSSVNDRMDGSTWSQVGSVYSRKYLMRMAAAAQVLNRWKRWGLVQNHLSGQRTYKNPRQNMPISRHFCARGKRRLLSAGSGRTRTAT